MTALTVPDPARRADLAAFVARVVQLDPAATVRLLGSGSVGGADRVGGAGLVTAWASTPFDVLATRSVPAMLVPADVVVPAAALLTALAVERADTVDPGSGARWSGELPPEGGWSPVAELATAELVQLTEQGLATARERDLSPELLDGTAVTLRDPAGPVVRVPLRCLFALSGLGLLDSDGDPVRVSVTGSWLRLDTTLAAVVRRRSVSLPLLL
jgi:hypothetical protein